MFAFTPPTTNEAPAGEGPLFVRFVLSRGISLIKQNGHFVEHRYPSLLDLEGLTQGVDYFLGGYNYFVSEPIAEQLVADGFTIGSGYTDIYLDHYTDGLPGYTGLYLGKYT